jgi:hypothetical protein
MVGPLGRRRNLLALLLGQGFSLGDDSSQRRDVSFQGRDSLGRHFGFMVLLLTQCFSLGDGSL